MTPLNVALMLPDRQHGIAEAAAIGDAGRGRAGERGDLLSSAVEIEGGAGGNGDRRGRREIADGAGSDVGRRDAILGRQIYLAERRFVPALSVVL